MWGCISHGTCIITHTGCNSGTVFRRYCTVSEPSAYLIDKQRPVILLLTFKFSCENPRPVGSSQDQHNDMACAGDDVDNGSGWPKAYFWTAATPNRHFTFAPRELMGLAFPSPDETLAGIY